MANNEISGAHKNGCFVATYYGLDAKTHGCFEILLVSLEHRSGLPYLSCTMILAIQYLTDTRGQIDPFW